MNKRDVETFKKLTKLDSVQLCDTFYSIIGQLLRQELFQMEQLLSPIFQPDVLNNVFPNFIYHLSDHANNMRLDFMQSL